MSNLDAKPLHLIRIEFKNGSPKQYKAGVGSREFSVAVQPELTSHIEAVRVPVHASALQF